MGSRNRATVNYVRTVAARRGAGLGCAVGESHWRRDSR